MMSLMIKEKAVTFKELEKNGFQRLRDNQYPGASASS